MNIVSRELFAAFPTARDMACGEVSEIERIVKPCGLYRMKARNIKDCAEIISSRYGGDIPNTMEELVMLPGVGRKIANLLLGDVFGLPAIVCETHCMRICGRFGMYPETLRDPTKIEKILRELMNPSDGSDFCHRIVLFGREICTARNPACHICPIGELCEHNRKAVK